MFGAFQPLAVVDFGHTLQLSPCANEFLKRLFPDLRADAGQLSTIRVLSQVLLNEPWAQVDVELYQR